MNTKIQFITASVDSHKQSQFACASLSNPFAVDMYDVNIVDLTNMCIWRNRGNDYHSIEFIKDFRSFKSIAQNSKSSVIVYVLPQNLQFFYNYFQGRYLASIHLKDIIDSLTEDLLATILPLDMRGALIFENSLSGINGEKFSSSFSFLPDWVAQNKVTVLTQADGSQKATTVSSGRYIITTLQITRNEQKLLTYLQGLHLLKETSDNYPDWLLVHDILDDQDLKTQIANCRMRISEDEQTINLAEKKRQENLKYKSILVETGDTLVETVFRILEELLAVDLSGFIDEKKEDFLFSCNDVSFIGEIKGISTNVKSENVSQVERHFQAYQDKLQDEGRQETVKQLLIINPFRNKPLDQRDPVHGNQINLAKRNGCLIILTETLLTIFERFRNRQITTSDIKKVFSEKTGLLSMDDISLQN